MQHRYIGHDCKIVTIEEKIQRHLAAIQRGVVPDDLVAAIMAMDPTVKYQHEADRRDTPDREPRGRN